MTPPPGHVGPSTRWTEPSARHSQPRDTKAQPIGCAIDTVYVDQPKGFEEYGPLGEKMVCRLNKSMYGTVQGSRLFALEFARVLKLIGYSACVTK